MNNEELDFDKTIDPLQLDVEAARQADVFFKWAERYVEAKSLVDRLSFELSVFEAKLQLKIRRHPDNYNLPSVTEAAIKALVLKDQEYQDKVRQLRDAQQESDLLAKAVAAIEQKKRMIEVLITLHGQQYFAGPSVPRDLASAWKEHQEKAETQLNKRQGAVARRRVTRGDDV